MEISSTFGGKIDGFSFKGSQSTVQQSLSQQDFLQLMVAQLQNQNPMEPQDSTDFFQQMATFEQMSTLREIADGIVALSTFSELANASSLVGRTVTALIPAGTSFRGETLMSSELVTGTVDRVTFDDGSPFIHVGGAIIRPAFVTEVA